MKRGLMVLCLVAVGALVSAGSAFASTSSANVALVPSAYGQADNGGTMATTGFPGGLAPTFSNVSLASIRDDATDPLASYDTVALVQVCNIGTYLQNAQFKSRLEGFVSRGGKLLIWDSECQSTDYSRFVYPFATSNPGAAGASGTLSTIESNTIGSTDPASPYYINDAAISSGTDAVGDANVFVTYSSDWCGAKTATNTLGVNGPVLVYARLGAGLIIYTGLDMDYMGYSSSFDPTSTSGYAHLNRLWYLQLLQPFNPDSGLPCGVRVFGVQMSPKSASNLEGTSHTVTATVTSNAEPQSGVAVTFTVTSGPNTGQTGTGTTDANGVASWTYADDGGFGTDTIEASANLQGHAASDTATKDWTDQPLTATGTTLSTTAGEPLSATVASFTDPFVKGVLSDYSATIDWGDGQTSAGTINGAAGSFTVTGTHTYQKAGSYSAVVTINDRGGATATATTAVTVNAPVPVGVVEAVHRVKVIHGKAKLTGVPHGCVVRGFTLHITGKRIASVTWFADGRRIGGKMLHRGTSYTAYVDVNPGTHKMTVKVKYAADSKTNPRTFRATVFGCPASVPTFTG